MYSAHNKIIRFMTLTRPGVNRGFMRSTFSLNFSTTSIPAGRAPRSLCPHIKLPAPILWRFTSLWILVFSGVFRFNNQFAHSCHLETFALWNEPEFNFTSDLRLQVISKTTRNYKLVNLFVGLTPGFLVISARVNIFWWIIPPFVNFKKWLTI